MVTESERKQSSTAINEQKLSVNQRKYMRMVEHEMSEAFRLTEIEHPFMQELKRLCAARRMSALAITNGALDE